MRSNYAPHVFPVCSNGFPSVYLSRSICVPIVLQMRAQMHSCDSDVFQLYTKCVLRLPGCLPIVVQICSNVSHVFQQFSKRVPNVSPTRSNRSPIVLQMSSMCVLNVFHVFQMCAKCVNCVPRAAGVVSMCPKCVPSVLQMCSRCFRMVFGGCACRGPNHCLPTLFEMRSQCVPHVLPLCYKDVTPVHKCVPKAYRMRSNCVLVCSRALPNMF